MQNVLNLTAKLLNNNPPYHFSFIKRNPHIIPNNFLSYRIQILSFDKLSLNYQVKPTKEIFTVSVNKHKAHMALISLLGHLGPQRELEIIKRD